MSKKTLREDVPPASPSAQELDADPELDAGPQTEGRRTRYAILNSNDVAKSEESEDVLLRQH